MPWIPSCAIADRAAIFSNHDAFLEHKVLALPLRIGAYACGSALGKNVRQCMAQPVEPLPHRDAVLQEKAADLIDDRCPLPYQAVAHTMQRLRIELLVRFRRYVPRRGTLYGFSNRMRISKIILVSLPERLGVGRRHLPHVVAEGEQLTAT